MKKRQRIVCFAVVCMMMLCAANAFGAVAGDVDNSGTIDVKDAVTALQVCAGMKPSVNLGADVNKDGNIGLEEAVYVVQYVTGLFEPSLILPAKPYDQSNIIFSYHDETGNVRFLKAEPGYAIAQPTSLDPSVSPEAAAQTFLGFYGSVFGLTNPTAELGVSEIKPASQGRTFVRFQQRYNGVSVLGGELVVQLDAAKNVISVNGEILTGSKAKGSPVFTTKKARRNILKQVSVDTTPSIPANTARQTALATVAGIYGQSADEFIADAPSLQIYNPVMLGFSEPDENLLVWKTEVTPVKIAPINEFVLVDAHSGAAVLHFNQLDTVRNRSTYNARENILCRSEGQGDSGDSDCDRAHDYTGDTYDFYRNEHGRDSIDNAGMELISYVHFGDNYCNAFWNGEWMTYGDGCGIVVDDVVAHEITHGVTQHESGLIYLNQSGAINESFSDIWGEFVDQTNGKGTDTQEVRWKMGEEITGLGAIRDMKDPAVFGDPDKITSDLYYCGIGDNGGVHSNSGVGNKAAYLMTDGGEFNGYTVNGLGYAKVADLFYEAQTKLLTSSAGYADLYDALILACSNLGYSADDCQQVQNALFAVEMYLPPCQSQQCTYSIQPAEKSFTSDGGTGIVNVTAPDGCAWSAESKDNWIKILSYGASGNGTVNYSVDSYSEINERSGTMIIAGKTFRVIQSGRDVKSPVANAGDDKTVNEGDRVTLVGSGTDSDGYIVSYEWEKISGPDITLSNTVSANVTFTAPEVGESGATLTFQLTVTDNDGLTGTDTCNVYVQNKDDDTYTNSLGMTFKLIPAGTFMMGCSEEYDGYCYDEEKPRHQVTLTQAFYMQTTEVTQGQWKAVMGSNPSYFQNCGDDCPVDQVSWDDIQPFIAKMNQRGEGTYRLPTEAEWEYAARAGSTTAFSNGGITYTELNCEYDPNLDAIGWYCWNSDNKTHPVAQKQANAWGLYDMSGNVWEWVQDWYGVYQSGADTNPTGADTGSYRVVRGGSWFHFRWHCRSAFRGGNSPSGRYYGHGFRLALISRSAKSAR